MRIISIGTDRKVFEEGSAVRARLLKQRELFEELHVIVFAPRSSGLRAEQLGNLWLYSTDSLSRLFYVRDAVTLARGLITQRNMSGKDTVITAQDPFECGLSAFFASKEKKIPIQLQVHTDFLNLEFTEISFLNKIRVRLAHYLLPRASGIRVVSKRIADSLRESGMKLNNSIDVLPVFSVHALKWGLKPLRRFKHKADKEGCLVLLPCRLAPEKDISLALKALEKVRNEGQAIGLVIVGEGPEQARIRDEIAVRRLSGGVRLELWQSDLSSFYRVSDVVLLTSRFEGFGLVLLEAAVHGQPIVTTDVGIARELIPPKYERFICPVGDDECVAGRLAELAKDLELGHAYGSALRSSAKKLIIPEVEYWKLFKAQLEKCLIPHA